MVVLRRYLFVYLLLFIGSSHASDLKQDVLIQMEAWLSSWIEANPEDYIALYERDFTGPHLNSHKEWSDWVGQRFKMAENEDVQITLSDVEYSEINHSTVEVEFTQVYIRDSYRDIVRKKLVFIKTDESWRINKEQVVLGYL